MTTRAANRASGADQLDLAASRRDMISAQVATTLTRAAMRTFSLAGVTNFITADGTLAAVFGAGALATGPTQAPAGVTIFLLADWARRNSALLTENLLASCTLVQTIVAGDMTVAIDGDFCRFLVT